MRSVPVFWIAFLLLLSAGVGRAEVRNVEIIGPGIYTAELLSSSRDERGLKQNISRNFRRAVATTDIPMQIGVRFGFQYRVNGSPANSVVTLRKVTIYPPAGVLPSGTQKRLAQDESTVTAKIGEIRYTGYRFDDSWELVPGPWVMQLWLGSRKVAEQKFTIKPR